MKRSTVALIGFGLFLALFFPSYPVQWLGYSIVFVIVLSHGYSRAVGRALLIDRAEPELKAYQHQSVTVAITIRNRSILPVPMLVVTDNPGSLYSGYDNNRLMSLAPGERTQLAYTIKGMNRGAYRIGPITVRFSDPLGLFPVEQTIHQESRLIVYPRIYPLELPVHHGLPAGSITAASRIYEDPTRYRSVREYIPGDELRRINWKASARLGSLHSTEWLPTINVPVMVLLNLTAAAYEQRNRYAHTERAIDAAASLVHHLTERGQATGLITTGIMQGLAETVMPSIQVGSGAQHATGILETLAQLGPNPEDVDPAQRFLDHGRISFGTRLFYLGPALAPESVAGLLAAVKDRTLVRLYYVDEGVIQPHTIDRVHVYRVSEYGDELFTLQT